MLKRADVPFKVEHPSGLSVIIVTLSGSDGQGDWGAECDWRFDLSGSLYEVEVWGPDT